MAIDPISNKGGANKKKKLAHYILSNSDRPRDQLVSYSLKGKNYSTQWKSIINILESKHKIGFVDRRLPKPSVGDLKEKDWITCNSMVMSWILNSLNEELHKSVAYHDMTLGMWKGLEECFSQGSDLRIQEIKRDITNTRQGDMAISFYYAKVRGLWE